MEYSLTREQSRDIDRLAIEGYGVRGIILMENAGRQCATVAEQMIEDYDNPSVAVFCGGGNNGGDGFVIARHLWNHDVQVQIYVVGNTDDILSEGSDASTNLEIVLNMELPIQEISDRSDIKRAVGQAADTDLIVDALLGTGISGEVRGPFRPLIDALNQVDVPVLAVDMPSGLDCNTGEVMGVAVRADETVTFVMKKRGQTQRDAKQYVGRLHVAEISVPRQLIEKKIEHWFEEGE